MRWIHIAAGLSSLVFGAVALYATKGSTLHRRSGLVFVLAMLTMTSSAFVMAVFLRPNRLNAVAATLTAYLVVTALVTVRRRVDEARTLIAACMAVALIAAAYAFAIAAAGTPGRDEPGVAIAIFGAVALLGAFGDWRLLRAGRIDGPRRLARHLWRMTLALWIATASFFLGQAQFFPVGVRRSGLLAVPVLLVLGLLIYWFVRTRFARRRGPAPQA